MKGNQEAHPDSEGLERNGAFGNVPDPDTKKTMELSVNLRSISAGLGARASPH